MSEYSLERVDDGHYALYHGIYMEQNIYLSYDWQETLETFRPSGDGYFLLKNGILLGGVVIREDTLTAPFLIAPYSDHRDFWRGVLSCLDRGAGTELLVNRVERVHGDALRALGAKLRWTQRRMQRPTADCEVQPDGEFCFDELHKKDLGEVARTVYEAHREGYTSTVYGVRGLPELRETICGRYELFARTSSLHYTTLVRRKSTQSLVGVCMAGVYPDSPNRFATIHQVAVLPKCRGRGLAKAMILNTISTAHRESPVINLGVLVGNPAEKLYRDLGFRPGPEYSDWSITV